MPGDHSAHQAATGRALDLLGLQVGLRLHQLVLHGLSLRKQVGHVETTSTATVEHAISSSSRHLNSHQP